MNKVRLHFKYLSQIEGSPEVGLLVLVNEDESRQLTVPCDRAMLYQLGLRLDHPDLTSSMVPEVLWHVLQEVSDDTYELIILDCIDGEYRTILQNNTTLEPVPIRASDAILLAYLSHIPLYIKEELMNRQSVPYHKFSQGVSIPVNTLTDSMLQDALNKAVEEERYELASYLRDEMKRRKKRG